jgi:UDP-N-acetylmuramyl tripeptide synthase
MPQIVIFPFYGPNRHNDRRLVECRLNFDMDKDGEFPSKVSDVQDLLIRYGIVKSKDPCLQTLTGKSRIDWYSSLFVQTVLALQTGNGHRVEFCSVSTDLPRQSSVALVEYVNVETVMAAFKFTVEVFSGRQNDLKTTHSQFVALARERSLALQTIAIINTARRKNISVLQIDDQPFNAALRNNIVGHSLAFRVRPNGLLSLGQGANRLLLDGTFCLDRSDDYINAMLRNPGQRIDLLKQLGISIVHAGSQATDEPALLKLLVIDRNITAVILVSECQAQIVTELPQSMITQALALGGKFGFAPLVISYQVSYVDQCVTASNCRAIGFELGPDLDDLFKFCPSQSDLISTAADQIINWLYPDPGCAKIPTIAVTGTNGKTTTSRMLHHILSFKGHETGLVCTDGIFLGQKQLINEDAGTFRGHAVVLTSKLVDAAVLEAHHRGIAVHGFAFQNCDVGICLNVTEEHLAKGGIESVEEMAVVKRALVERAAHAAILFVDNEHCAGMIEHMKSKYICLVSLKSSAKELSQLPIPAKSSFCVLEMVQGQSWIVLHKAQKRLPVMPVSEIPATFNGTAKFNISNSMHAIAAAYFSGVEISAMRSALRIFRAGLELTPGRMNVFDGLPFKVIIDFAHNQDGVRNICEFADLQPVTGRKVIAFAGQSSRSDYLNRLVAKTVVGHFDFYFCKDYQSTENMESKLVGSFMQDVLLEHGVPKDATSVVTYGRDVIFKILDSCEAGDLLILLLGHKEIKSVPGYIEHYRQRMTARL